MCNENYPKIKVKIFLVLLWLGTLLKKCVSLVGHACYTPTEKLEINVFYVYKDRFLKSKAFFKLI